MAWARFTPWRSSGTPVEGHFRGHFAQNHPQRSQFVPHLTSKRRDTQIPFLYTGPRAIQICKDCRECIRVPRDMAWARFTPGGPRGPLLRAIWVIFAQNHPPKIALFTPSNLKTGHADTFFVHGTKGYPNMQRVLGMVQGTSRYGLGKVHPWRSSGTPPEGHFRGRFCPKPPPKIAILPHLTSKRRDTQIPFVYTGPRAIQICKDLLEWIRVPRDMAWLEVLGDPC